MSGGAAPRGALPRRPIHPLHELSVLYLTPLMREAAQTAEAGFVAPQEAPEHEAG